MAVTMKTNLQSLIVLLGISLCVVGVTAGEERDLGWGRWRKDDDDWGGWSKSSKTAEPTFYPTLSPTLSKSSKSSWHGWHGWHGWKKDDDDDDDWGGWRKNKRGNKKKKKKVTKRRRGHHNRWGRDLVGDELDTGNKRNGVIEVKTGTKEKDNVEAVQNGLNDSAGK